MTKVLIGISEIENINIKLQFESKCTCGIWKAWQYSLESFVTIFFHQLRFVFSSFALRRSYVSHVDGSISETVRMWFLPLDPKAPFPIICGLSPQTPSNFYEFALLTIPRICIYRVRNATTMLTMWNKIFVFRLYTIVSDVQFEKMEHLELNFWKQQKRTVGL